MIIKFLSFLLGLIWSYSFIRTQSIFSKKTAILFKVFISKVSWITFILACYFGYKNFSFKATLIGIGIAIIIVHLMFYFSKKYLENKFGAEKLEKSKTVLEYLASNIRSPKVALEESQGPKFCIIKFWSFGAVSEGGP